MRQTLGGSAEECCLFSGVDTNILSSCLSPCPCGPKVLDADGSGKGCGGQCLARESTLPTCRMPIFLVSTLGGGCGRARSLATSSGLKAKTNRFPLNTLAENTHAPAAGMRFTSSGARSIGQTKTAFRWTQADCGNNANCFVEHCRTCALRHSQRRENAGGAFGAIETKSLHA